MEKLTVQAKIDELIEKITQLNSGAFKNGEAKISQLEIDLMLQHLRKLYDAVLSMQKITTVTEEKKVEKEVNKKVESKSEVKEDLPAVRQEKKPEIIIPQAEAITKIPTAPPPPPAVKKDIVEEIPKVVEKKVEQVKKTSSSVKTEMFNRTPPKPSLNEKFTKETEGLGEKLGLKSITDLKTAIGVNQRFAFINELFGRNFSEYDNSIKQLNGFKSHEEASSFINAQLKNKYKWDEKNQTVKEFMELVKRRFLTS